MRDSACLEPDMPAGFCALRLERVFAACFAANYSTRLAGGASEPYYRPAGQAGRHHLLRYREDYFASALHEVAHWCIAGPERRLRPDFGYWYAPDGRSAVEQRAFEAVEYRPQALEWHFSRACGYRFRVSLDNLDGGEEAVMDTLRFRRRLVDQANHWRATGLPRRAARFAAALRREFGVPGELPEFTLAELD